MYHDFFFANHHNVSCFVTNIQQYVQQYVQHVLYRSYFFSFLLHLLRFFVWFHFFSGVLFSSHYLWDGRRRSGWVRRTTKRKDRQFLIVWNTIKSYTNCWKLCHIFLFSLIFGNFIIHSSAIWFGFEYIGHTVVFVSF